MLDITKLEDIIERLELGEEFKDLATDSEALEMACYALEMYSYREEALILNGYMDEISFRLQGNSSEVLKEISELLRMWRRECVPVEECEIKEYKIARVSLKRKKK